MNKKIKKLLPCKCGHKYEHHTRQINGVDIMAALSCLLKGLNPTQGCIHCKKCTGFIILNNLEYLEKKYNERSSH